MTDIHPLADLLDAQREVSLRHAAVEAAKRSTDSATERFEEALLANEKLQRLVVLIDEGLEDLPGLHQSMGREDKLAWLKFALSIVEEAQKPELRMQEVSDDDLGCDPGEWVGDK